MDYKVSVIIPIYHSEPFLEECCRSLFNQSLDDIEFLFIIDGPSDESKNIINRASDEYPMRKQDVQIIQHEQNLGISRCRQEGHDLANGKYIFHCDSDDWMEPVALQLLVEKAEKEQSDMVFFDYERHYEKKVVKYVASGVQRGEIPTLDAPLHNKLFRADLVRKHNLRFPQNINWGEDMCMSVLCQILAKKIAYLPLCLYHQTMHPQSFTSKINKDKYMQLVECPKSIEEELQKRGYGDKFVGMLMQMKYEVKEYFLILPQLRDIRQWKTVYPECHAYIWQFANVPLYLKVVSTFIVHDMDWLVRLLLICRDGYNSLR